MRLSWNWLSDFVDLSALKPEDLVRDLPSIGIETEDVERTGEDAVLSLEITPNRGDCLSIFGLAREVAAFYKRKLMPPETRCREGKEALNKYVALQVRDKKLCPFYSGRLIEGVVIAESPEWLKEKLEAVGIRPINNVVDVTNYVMMEIGQPLHAFDFERIPSKGSKKKVVVRSASEGEVFYTLDGIERRLAHGDIVIGDGLGGILALGGVMGGLYSEVSPETIHVFLESAVFDPVSVRKTSKRLAIQTESSYRFERHVDSGSTARALDRAASLICEVAGGTIAKGRVEEGMMGVGKSIMLPFSSIRELLGFEVKRAEVKAVLQRLGFRAALKGNALTVKVPSFRTDILQKEDLIEEVGRLIGYEKIPALLPKGVVSKITDPELSKKRQVVQELRRILRAAGVDEVILYSFTSLRELNPFLTHGQVPLRLENPLGENLAYMKTTLVGGILRAISENAKRNIWDAAIYEMRRTFEPLRDGVREALHLAIGLTGKRGEDAWHAKFGEVDFYDAKGIGEQLFCALRIVPELHQGESPPWLHPTVSATVKSGDSVLGYLGEVHPEILPAFGLERKVFVASFNVDEIVRLATFRTSVKPLNKFPPVYRDLSFLVGKDISHDEIMKAIASVRSKCLTHVRLFDLYEGERIAAGKKSLAYGFIFESFERTLSEAEVEGEIKRILETLEKRVGAELRS